MKRSSGVTLIEVMVAVSIIAIVATLMYTGFTQTASNKKRIESEIDRYHEIRMGMERMVRELSMAFVSIHVNDNPSLQPVRTAFIGKDASGGSRIDFTSFSHQRLYRDAHESDQNELSYYIADDPADSSKNVLVRREQRRIDDDPQDGGHSQVLINDVLEFELSYLDPQSGEFSSLWDSTQGAMQLNRLPTQVMVKVTVPNVRGTGPKQTFGTRAVLQMQYALNHAVYR